MKIKMIGIGEYGITNSGEILKTMALGSCVAVILIERASSTFGMVHIALPSAEINKEKAGILPGYFADTGIPLLINKMRDYGFSGFNRNLIAKITGGASVMDSNQFFNIGDRNIAAVKKVLYELGININAEDVGGTISRTVTVDSSNGKVIITSPGLSAWEI